MAIVNTALKLNPDGTGGSWFGNLLRDAKDYIVSHLDVIVASIFPGPIGLALGSLLSAWADAGVDVNFRVSNEVDRKWVYYFNNNVLPSFTNMAASIDHSIEALSFSRGGANEVVNKANLLMSQVATLKAYAYHLEANGEVNQTESYIAHKSITILKFAEFIEKPIISYVENNTDGYKLVTEEKTVSNLSSIELIDLNFGNTIVKSQVKSYVTTAAQGQTEVDVVNTDPTDITPAISLAAQEVENNIEVTKSNKMLYFLGIAAIGFLAYKKYKK